MMKETRTMRKIRLATNWRTVWCLLHLEANKLFDTVTRDRIHYVIEQAGINVVDSTSELQRQCDRDTDTAFAMDLPKAQKGCFLGSCGVLLADRDGYSKKVVRWFAVRGIAA